MAYELAKVVSASMDADNWKHELTGENQEVILTGVAGENNIKGLEFAIFFDEERTVNVVSRDYVHVPEDKIEAMYSVMNELNTQYRWAKFAIDNDGDIHVEADAVLDMDSCGDEIKEILIRLTHLADIGYPTIMKALFGA